MILTTDISGIQRPLIICSFKLSFLLIAIASIIIIFFLPVMISKRLEVKNSQKFNIGRKMLAEIDENITMQNVIRVLDVSRVFRKFFIKTDVDLTNNGRDVYFYNGLITACSDIVPIFLLLLFLAISSYLASRGLITISLLVSFQLMFSNIVYSVVRLSYNVPWVLSGSLALKEIKEFLSILPEASAEEDAGKISSYDSEVEKTAQNTDQSISFENVYFGYDTDQENVGNISFTIPKNSSVAFVGPSGAGKSTILNLILGLYVPSKGSIKIDSVNIARISKQSLYQKIGAVFQEPILFNISIWDNIKLGNLNATNEMIIKAAKSAEIHDSIMQMQEGYDTLAGEGGKHLSGGQRQRVAIARALLKDPEILVFDEITSALDPASEAAINKIVAKLAKSHTTIIVTHRLESITHVDKIFVMNGGEIVESGSHLALLAKKGAYFELWEKQQL